MLWIITELRNTVNNLGIKHFLEEILIPLSQHSCDRIFAARSSFSKNVSGTKRAGLDFGEGVFFGIRPDNA
jgi:hypothetical protein